MSNAVVRVALPTFSEAEKCAEQGGVNYAIDFLVLCGFPHAAHRLSVDYWGYGLDDTQTYDVAWEDDGADVTEVTQ